MDFTNLDLGEDLSKNNNQADRDVWQAEQQARIHKESLQRFGVAPISKIQLPRVAENPVTQLEYNTRLYSILNMIWDTSHTEKTYPLADTWKELYPHVQYNPKATNWKISAKDTDRITKEMLDYGIKPKFRKIDGVRGVIDVITDAHKTNIISEQAKKLALQDERIRNYEFLLDGVKDQIVYRGHVLPYSAKHRGYHLTLGGKKLVVSQKNVEKLQSVFDFIDLFED